MNSNPQDFSPAFSESVPLLLQLHHEMVTGDPDGERADEIRDAMERPWYAMSETEQQLIRLLSADLYTIGHPWQSGAQPKTDAVEAIMENLRTGQAEALLAILHDHERSLPPESVAFLRGLAWSLLGQFDAAIEFLEEAVKVGPKEWAACMHVLLQTLISADRTADAFARVQHIASHSNDALLLLDAAEVSFIHSTEVEQDESEPLIEMARENAKKGLNLARQAQPNPILRAQCVRVHLWLALDFARENSLAAAHREIAEARSLSPRDPSTLFVEAFLKQKSHSGTWDQGIGRGLIQLRGVPSEVLQYEPNMISSTY